MIAQTIRQLNVHYSRRVSNNTSSVSSPQNTTGNASREPGSARTIRLVNLSWSGVLGRDDVDSPPLACHKVIFLFLQIISSTHFLLLSL